MTSFVIGNYFLVFLFNDCTFTLGTCSTSQQYIYNHTYNVQRMVIRWHSHIQVQWTSQHSHLLNATHTYHGSVLCAYAYGSKHSPTHYCIYICMYVGVYVRVFFHMHSTYIVDTNIHPSTPPHPHTHTHTHPHTCIHLHTLTHYNLVLGILQILHGDRIMTVSWSPQGSLVDHVSQVGS